MTQKPILFSAPMVRAILDGRKSQTRRICRAQNGYASKPPYRADDMLWVRETWGLHDTQPSDGPNDAHVYYRATDGAARALRHQLWRPAIFMPRWACRLFLRVTAVRCERLQEITEADAIAEGTAAVFPRGIVRHVPLYAELWDSINVKRAPWASNPWVWVIEFERAPAP